MAGECTINAPTISAQACVQASCLWDSFERQHITLWFDNYRRYINGMDPHSPDKTLNVTVVGVLHATELPQYHGLPGLDAVAERIPGVVDYLVRCVGLLLQRSTVPDGPIVRTWVCGTLDHARNAVVSLNRRPFVLSHLESGSHVELLEFVRGLECLRVNTGRSVPFLIDMKIFYPLLKMLFGASYAPWHVDQFLLGHPLPYGVWHRYKYSVEITCMAFAPIIKFFEQGWDLKAGALVPMKVKLRHMEKTIVGLFLATAANKARLDSTTQVLMSNLAELSDAQRLGLKCLLALKALLYSYCPALLALGVLVCECNWNGRSLHPSAAAKECIGMNNVLMMITRETADVRAYVSNLKAACAEEFFHADVCVHNLSKPSALYSMRQTPLALCSLHQFSARLPRYLPYIQGPLTTAIPVEVFCHLLYALDLIQQNSTWVMICTRQPAFSAALSIQRCFL